MALSSDQLDALIDLRVCELRELAAWTAVEYWRLRPRPTLAELVALREERDVSAVGVLNKHGHWPNVRSWGEPDMPRWRE